jgi:hypothetical protein
MRPALPYWDFIGYICVCFLITSVFALGLDICVRYTRGGQGFTRQVFEGGGSRFFSLSPRLSLCAMGMDGNGIEDETRVCKRKKPVQDGLFALTLWPACRD